MKLNYKGNYMPGTIIPRGYTGSGSGFIDKVFFVSDGIMLNGIKEITGVDGSTLQNWVKRGWLGKTVNRRYSRNQLSRILIINILKGSLLFEEIDYLLHYLNGNIDDTDDDIISEYELYDLTCRIIFTFEESNFDTVEELESLVSTVTKELPLGNEESRTRLKSTLRIIAVAYYESLISDNVRLMFAKIK
ncbi:MAG: DUF1836 domain-containing protein [Clostridia bacterium]|nr:DUF1836 domain-containing protein [Clostridia bacterium]